MEKVIDWHCDALYKMVDDLDIDFLDDKRLDVNYQKLVAGGVKVQAFAIFIDPEIPVEKKYDACLAQIDAFMNRVLSVKNMVHIKNFKNIDSLEEDQIGAFLTLEGLDCVADDLMRVSNLLDLGVLSIGMTWNVANLACDGIGEGRGAGLSDFGKSVVALANQRGVFIDVSHISLKGFDDVLESADLVIASHSNVQAIAGHRRNLSDRQIQMMKDKGALIHLVYCVQFIVDEGGAVIDDLLDHVAYYVSKGVGHLLGLGSDFDGIQDKVVNLEDSSMTQNLIQALENRFGIELAQSIANGNFINYINKI